MSTATHASMRPPRIAAEYLMDGLRTVAYTGLASMRPPRIAAEYSETAPATSAPSTASMRPPRIAAEYVDRSECVGDIARLQ